MKRPLLASCRFIFLSAAIFLAAQTAVASCDTSTVLALCVTATPDPVKPGEHIVYSYKVANRGAVDLAGVVLTTLVPDHTRANSSSITDGGDCAVSCLAGDKVTWSLGTLFAGQSRTVQMPARVDTSSPPADGTVISDSATVVDGSGHSAVATRSVVADNAPVLMLSIAGDREPVEPGEVLTYTLTFGNRGAVNAPGVTLSASVPAGTTFVSASDGGTQSGGTVSWPLGTVSVGESGRRQFTVQLSAGLSNGSQLLSNASIQDGVDPQDTARASVSTAVRSVASSPLTLSLTAAPDPVRPGEQIVYSYTVANRGVVDLAGVVLTTLVPDHTRANSSSITDGGDCAVSCLAGDKVTWSLGTLFAGQSRTVQMPARVDTSSPPADGTVISDSATVVDGSGHTAVAARSVVADNTPVLMLSIAGDREPVAPGEVLTYTLTVGNRGAVNAPGVTLSASVPAGTTFVSASDGGTQSGGTVSWFLGTVSVGESGRRQFTVQVSAGLSNGSLFISDASIQDGVDPQDTSRASVSTAVRSLASSPLTLSLTATPDPVRPGEHIVYSYKVANRGAVDLAGVVLTTLVPDHTRTDTNSITGGGQCVSGFNCFAGDKTTWSLGTLFAGQSRTVQMATRIDTSAPPADGTVISDTATVIHGAQIFDARDTVATRVCAAGGTSCDVPRSVVKPPLYFDADFDGDGKADVGIYRDGNWYIIRSSNGGVTAIGWGGLAQDIPVPADYDGDGKTDIAVYRDGNWYIIRSSNGGVTVTGWGGLAQDIPVPADYDGDGKTDIAVYRNGGWYIIRSSDGGVTGVGWGGLPQDIPVPADYDGDGKTDIAVYRNGGWYIIRSSDGGVTGVGWGGLPQDIPVPADYDGDGKTDIAVYRNGGWYIIRSSDGGVTGVGWGGLPQDIPVQTDYDGDGRTDVAVYRDGGWYIIRSSDGGVTGVGWGGLPQDIPLN